MSRDPKVILADIQAIAERSGQEHQASMLGILRSLLQVVEAIEKLNSHVGDIDERLKKLEAK